MKLSSIEFCLPVRDPCNPKGIWRTEYKEPYSIELEGGVVTITALDGRSVVTTHRFHGVVVAPEFKIADEDTQSDTPKSKLRKDSKWK